MEEKENLYLNKRVKLFQKDAKKSIILSLTNICCLVCPWFANFELGDSSANIFILFFISIITLGPISIISNISTLIVHHGITKINNSKKIKNLYIFLWIALFLCVLPYLFFLLAYINE